MFPADLFKSFAQKLQSSRAEGIFLVRGKDPAGRAAWYYVEVDKAKRDFFAKHAHATFNLLDYGRIIISGFGEHPPADVVTRMKDEYGFSE